MIDSHTHLDLCDGSDAELVAAATAVGVSRMLTVGIDGASCRAALATAEDFPQVYAAIGRHPNAAKGFDDGDLAELKALAAHPRCLAIGETGLDFYRQGAPVEDQARAFAAQIALARQTAKPLVIHTRAATEETLSQLAAQIAAYLAPPGYGEGFIELGFEELVAMMVEADLELLSASGGQADDSFGPDSW